jgi:hypothetical protein
MSAKLYEINDDVTQCVGDEIASTCRPHIHAWGSFIELIAEVRGIKQGKDVRRWDSVEDDGYCGEI